MATRKRAVCVQGHGAGVVSCNGGIIVFRGRWFNGEAIVAVGAAAMAPVFSMVKLKGRCSD